jgi:hypothetical protein
MMAATFDPHELKRLKAIGFAPNPELARVWYERAHDLGHPEAGRRLRRLAAPP